MLKLRDCVEWLGVSAAVPIIVTGAFCAAFLSNCSSASAQTGPTYKDPIPKILDMVLTEKGYEVGEEKLARELVAKSAHRGAVSAGASWLGAAGKTAGRLAPGVGLAVTAYEVYNIWSGDDFESASPDGTDFPVQVALPLDNTWSNNLMDPLRSEDTVVTGWLNDFIECPGWGAVEDCIRDAVYKDLHAQIQRGNALWYEVTPSPIAEPGRVDVQQVEVRECSKDFSQPKPDIDRGLTAGSMDCEYTATVNIIYTSAIDGTPVGQSTVEMKGRVNLNTIRTKNGNQVAVQTDCIQRPNVWPYNLMPQLCQGEPRKNSLAMVPVPLDQMNQANIIPEWLQNREPNPAMLAMLFNAWGDNVYDLPGWDGFDWLPITEQDIRDAYQKRLATIGEPVTIDDLRSPIRSPTQGYEWTPTQPSGQPGGGTNPNPNPNPDPDPDPGTDPDPGGGDDGIDLEHPVTGPPTLEHPTIEDIIDPALGVFPELRLFEIDGPPGQCPTWEIPYLNGDSATLESHCELLETGRPMIEIFSLIFFGLAAMRIVLTA